MSLHYEYVRDVKRGLNQICKRIITKIMIQQRNQSSHGDAMQIQCIITG